ncbi:MAG: hypothetical protein AVO34_01725 [Firmicutes bacterium ML8_F2]|jgi:hypothetical protein|nr:MAG: hypothetical protein AVO34_01725 [Firmicutes bacterium ML8_F2]
MSQKRKLAKNLEKVSKKFLDFDERKKLLDSLKGDRTEWFRWSAEIKNIFKNLDKTEAVKFSALVLALEQKPDSRFCLNQLKKFLIEKTEFYKYYDFKLERDLKKIKGKSKNLWISKILRLFISRSFLGILILALILGFIIWFYTDRESCLEFVNGVVGPFLKAIK